MKRTLKYLLICVLAMAEGTILFAQEDIRKEIVVVKPYQPKISDASKINIMPRINDSISIHPSFDYSIRPRKYEAPNQVRPIKAARMVGTPLTKLYKSQLRLGIGNYLNPLGELTVHSLRERKTQWGIDLNHYSINSKLKLENGVKVKPGFFENGVSLYGKKIYRESTLSGKLQGSYDGVNFYGYHPLIADTMVLQDDKIPRQTWLTLGGQVKMGSTHKDSLHLNYAGMLDYRYTLDHFSHAEHAAVLRVDLNERFRSGYTYGLGLGGQYYRTTESIDSLNNSLISLKPSLGKSTPEYTYRLGIGMVMDIRGTKASPHFYPDVLLEINLVKGVLTPYFGLDGHLQVNHYLAIAEENRVVTPGLHVKNTSHRIRGFIGLKGSFSSRISYDFRGSYDILSRMPFFVNDTLDPTGNSFSVVYDDLEWIRAGAEITYRQSERIQGLLRLSYNHYKLESLEKPWHRPGLTISLDEKYSLHNKIILDMGFIYMSKRYAPATTLDTEIITLKGFADLNLGVEYRYTKILSGFVRLNNILGARNQTWNLYPGMGFNVLLGFSYAL